MNRCTWSSPELVGPSGTLEATFSVNGAVTLAPAAGEVIFSVGVLPPPDEPDEPEEPPDPAVAEPHAATASSAAAPIVNVSVRCDRMDYSSKTKMYRTPLVGDTSGRIVWFSELTSGLL